MHVSEEMGQEYTVITVDQALYCKLMELKWSVPEYRVKLIPRLGGLHTQMNFLKVIGQHMKQSGLLDVWVECTLLGPGVAEKVLDGKDLKKGIRAHKLSLQALWRLLLPHLLLFLRTSNGGFYTKIMMAKEDPDDENIPNFVTMMMSNIFQEVMSMFINARSENDPNFAFWWQYMKMVTILLMFTRAQRDGIWDLHLSAFGQMLPFFMRYDHTNYAHWGTVYLAQMNQLPQEVLTEFQNGNFVVKRSDSQFNQVDPDQAQEWMNAIGKTSGGIVGITKTITAINRWALSYNLHTKISSDTKKMFHFDTDIVIEHDEGKPSQQKD